MADGWIELFNVETDKAKVLFVVDRFEPVDYGCGVFPLIEAVFFHDCVVDAQPSSQGPLRVRKDPGNEVG